jgi:DNA (cytosine-5)-methyltransferase 1
VHPAVLIGLRNPDLTVLKQENQNQTHVTPLKASLARGFVNEERIVIGPPPPKEKGGPKDDASLIREGKARLGSLWKLIERVRRGVLDVEWKKEDRVTPRSNYLRKVYVGGEVYQVSAAPILRGILIANGFSF